MEYYGKAVELAPDHAAVLGRIARGYYYLGFFGAMAPHEAFPKPSEACAKALAIDDSLAEACGYRALSFLYYEWDWEGADWAHLILGWAYELKGEYEQAIAEYKSAVALSGGVVIAHAALGHAFAQSGRPAEAEQVLADLVARSRQMYVSFYDIATIWPGFRDADKTFEWLDQAVEERASFLLHLQWDPRFDPLRDDARLRTLLTGIGIPEYSTVEFEALASWAGH